MRDTEQKVNDKNTLCRLLLVSFVIKNSQIVLEHNSYMNETRKIIVWFNLADFYIE